jgi:hypothetical protein
MTQTKETTAAANSRSNGQAPVPTHVAKVRHGYGKRATYERIGVAFRNDNGSFYVDLCGTQLVSKFMLYALDAKVEAAPANDGEVANGEAGE